MKSFKEFKERYQFNPNDENDILGKGGFGIVYIANDKVDKKYVAIKVCPARKDKYTLKNEIELAKRINHKNIIKFEFYDKYETETGTYEYAVMPFYRNKSLLEYINSKSKIDKIEVDQIILGLLDGIEALHKNNIIHRDIKSSNILIDKIEIRDNELNLIEIRTISVLTDFGISKDVNNKENARSHSTNIKTEEYAAPETFTNEISFLIDFWSLGVVTYEMLTRKRPFSPLNLDKGLSTEGFRTKLNENITHRQLSDPDTYNKLELKYQNFLNHCFGINGAERKDDVNIYKDIILEKLVDIKPEVIVDGGTTIDLISSINAIEQLLINKKYAEAEKEYQLAIKEYTVSPNLIVLKKKIDEIDESNLKPIYEVLDKNKIYQFEFKNRMTIVIILFASLCLIGYCLWYNSDYRKFYLWQNEERIRPFEGNEYQKNIKWYKINISKDIFDSINYDGYLFSPFKSYFNPDIICDTPIYIGTKLLHYTGGRYDDFTINKDGYGYSRNVGFYINKKDSVKFEGLFWKYKPEGYGKISWDNGDWFKGQVWVENDSIKYGDGIYFRKSIGRSIDVNKNGDSVGLHKRISLYGGA